MLKVGTLLRQYEIRAVLGEGGFATTYLSLDQNLNKEFAIKEYCPADFAFRDGSTVKIRPGNDSNFIWGKERFLEEARMLARFNHPNIVGVAQIFEENNTAYIVLEYQSGRSFDSWLKEIGTIPSQKELDLVLEPLLSALDAIHRNNVLHRDIAPDNLYLRDDGSPVLLDFGSAKEAIAARTKAVSAIVKDGFSPPEQYSSKGSSQGPWSDIYALSATIYFALTGSTPHGSTERLLDDKLAPLSGMQLAGFRSEFLLAVDWGLKLAPKDRPQSISQWREMLSMENARSSKNSQLQLNDASRNVSDASEINIIKNKEEKYTKVFIISVVAAVFAIGNYYAYTTFSSENAKNQAIQAETKARLDAIQRQNIELQMQAEQQRRRQQEIEQAEAKKAQLNDELRRRQNDLEEQRRRQAELEEQKRKQNETDRTELANACGNALNVTLNGWDYAPQFINAVSVVTNRGLSIQDCRERIGLSRNPMIVKAGGFDLPGHDMGGYVENTSLASCQLMCEKNQNCSGYTYNQKAKGGACQLKRILDRTLLTPTSSSDVVSAFKPDVSSLVFSVNIDIKWNNEAVGTLLQSGGAGFEDCALACNANASCKGFTWAESAQFCRLYSNITSLRRLTSGSGFRTGLKP